MAHDLDLVGAGLRALRGISRAWRLTKSEQQVLLGLHDPNLLDRWHQEPPAELPSEVLERISLVIGIFGGVNLLLPGPNRANVWMRAPNAAPMFAGRSALEVMIEDGSEGMWAVRHYLAVQNS